MEFQIIQSLEHEGMSYNAIVSSGKNAWYGHYSANSDMLKNSVENLSANRDGRPTTRIK
jgi:Xaa-Pro aminopeptidase